MKTNSSTSDLDSVTSPSLPIHLFLRSGEHDSDRKTSTSTLTNCSPHKMISSLGNKLHRTSKKKRTIHHSVLLAVTILASQMSLPSYTSAFHTSSSSSNKLSFKSHNTHWARSLPTEEIIKPLAPLTSSSKEKRMSVERAWEKAKILAMNDDSFEESNTSATPYLDLFTNAQDESKNGPKQISTRNRTAARPKGRPASVPGAMSRNTLLNMNEYEASKASDSYTLPPTAINMAPNIPTKRGRGRPRKNQNSFASMDEITSVAATSSSTDVQEELNNETTSANYNDVKNDTNSDNLQRNSRVKLNLPKARKMTDSEKEGETTGMMQTIGKGRKADDPPNLQRYFHTQLLTQDEEYTLGMKIQFLMKCEQVHEGLYETLGRLPTIVEWANACGFKENDSKRSDPNYQETELEMSLRPVKSEAWGEETDPTMFVGNGLANDSGPGRGRGRAKKRPVLYLKDFYDDSDIKFQNDDANKKRKDLKPINQGTVDDFIEIVLTGKEAKQRMVQCNMRLVVSISKRYKHVGVSIADLVQEGSIGLTRAAEKFDPKKGFKFSTYASWWIQQAVFRSIAYHSRTIRLPVHVHNLLNRVRRISGELKRIHGRMPTNEEMAAELQMPVEKFVKMLRLTRKVISLDMSKYQNNPKDIGQESLTSLGDTIDAAEVVHDENTPEQNVDRVLFRDDLKEMLDVLGEDEKRVITLRYGIEDGLTRTVTTVAAIMCESKSWVRSQECRALRKLRRPWYEKRLWEHQNSLRG